VGMIAARAQDGQVSRRQLVSPLLALSCILLLWRGMPCFSHRGERAYSRRRTVDVEGDRLGSLAGRAGVYSPEETKASAYLVK